MASTAPRPSETAAEATTPEWFMVVFAFAVFLSAFLLFQVQPLISRFILPWFGGSPGVWTAAMLFFQVLLFLGYTYSHLTSRLLSLRGQTLLHFGLLMVAILALPVIPRETWRPTSETEPTWRILGLLTATVGLPYFLLSSTGPLLQAWFARAYLGRSPYRLYALSNIGSLLALISYPVLIEPLLELPRQAWLWSAGFVLYVLVVGWCAVWGLRGARMRQTGLPAASGASALGAAAAAAPSWLRRAAWVALPALGSLMLLATTNHVCQDVAVVPFLWVIPLGLYLLSFVICFDRERWYRRGLWGVAAAVLIFLTAGTNRLPLLDDLSLAQELGLYLAAMFATCMVCHGELVRLRPGARHVTEFYLLMSAGGALGGVLVSLVAPRLFTSFYEWNLGLLGGFALALWAGCQTLSRVWLRRAAVSPRAWFSSRGSGLACGAMLIGGGVALGCILVWQQPKTGALYAARNFYGRVTVWERSRDRPTQHHRAFVSGSETHGRQLVEPSQRQRPIAYYAEHTGVARTLRCAGQRGPIRVGVVGLGVGTLAAYARPGDLYRFYEINPEVTHLARTWFYFLADCRGRCEVVGGDGRLALEREQDEPFDVLVLDAFSGDAVPVHLLTREALEIYLRRLKAHGYLVVHITNWSLDLSLVVRSLAAHFQLHTTRILTTREEERLLFPTDYIVLSRDAADLASLPPEVADEAEPPREVPLWTDHFSNLFQILK
jgi:spermidine synthase